MTHLHNDPQSFADEMIEGFAAAHASRIKRWPGGIITAHRPPEPKVAVVIGGGSGHYPAFAGLVGPGLADGAVMGNIFASPSAGQVVQISTAVDQGRGVLLTFGNYAGDVLQFTEGARRLAEQGIDARIVTVTDDIFSAQIGEIEKRRGIAGDLAVFKVAGAAAAAGAGLDDVERIARDAVARTRTMGVAFSGCTLPGATEPLFTVPEGRMSIGLGIHGEPGIGEVAVPPAAELAELLVGRLLAERPADATRVIPILNGLGSVKYEELFVLYSTIHRLLAEQGLTIIDPQVGEFCTSFDMAGLSLTLFWPSPELERLWFSPADSPAFGRGELAVTLPMPDSSVADLEAAPPDASVVDASDGSRAAAGTVARFLGRVADLMDQHAEELGRVDALAGDGDHGIGMQRGSRAACEAAAAAVANGAGVSTTLDRAAEAWSDRAGGTSGAIWAVILQTVGGALSNQDTPSEADWVAGLSATASAVTRFGGASIGDKTMVDALVPFAEELERSYRETLDLPYSLHTAAQSADRAANDSAALLPKRGRSRTHGERAIGIPDPGALSLALITAALAKHIQPFTTTHA